MLHPPVEELHVSVNGLWTAEFTTASGAGTGVVVFVDGRIMGGDAAYYYSGTYQEEGPRLNARLFVKHYAGPLTNVFGQLREVHLTLVASAGGQYIIARAYDPSFPWRQMSIKLQRVQQL
jgi:hypothetical protein